MSIPGTNIRTLRKQLGLSLKALATAADIDQGNLSKLERGEAGYSREALERIARVLHVSVGVLFSETSAVEAAALRMREVPVLTPKELLLWKGSGSLALSEEHRTLHADLENISRHSFAVRISEPDNSPWFEVGDELLFDAGRHPKANDIVLAQETSGRLVIGRFRPVTVEAGHEPRFDIIPLGLRVPVARGAGIKLHLRGTLTESRRYF